MISFFSCKEPSPELTERDQVKIIEEVTKMLENYCADIKSEGFLAELEYLDTSSQFFWIPPGYKSPISYDSVTTLIKENAPMYSLIDNEWESLEVKALSRDMASYAGQLHSFMMDTSGMSQKRRMMESGIAIRRGNGWKLLNGQTSFIYR